MQKLLVTAVRFGEARALIGTAVGSEQELVLRPHGVKWKRLGHWKVGKLLNF